MRQQEIAKALEVSPKNGSDMVKNNYSMTSQSVAFGSQQQINEPGTLEVFGEYLFEQIYRMITG